MSSEDDREGYLTIKYVGGETEVLPVPADDQECAFFLMEQLAKGESAVVKIGKRFMTVSPANVLSAGWSPLD